MKTRTVALVALVSFLPALGSAQSLAEMAEKTKKKKAAAKVITENDLKGSKARGSFGEAEATPEAPAAEGEAPKAEGADKGKAEEKTPEQIRAERQADIQKKIDEEKRMIGVVQKAMDDAQVQLSDLSNLTLGERRASLMRLLDEGKAEIAKREQAIADLEEQARREGISVSR